MASVLQDLGIAMGWDVLLLRGDPAGLARPHGLASGRIADLLLWRPGDGPGALALVLAQAALVAGLDPWGRPLTGGQAGGVASPDGPGRGLVLALRSGATVRRVVPAERRAAWAQARSCTLLAAGRSAGLGLWLACWRRHPWQRQWHWRCRPMPLLEFQRRFLPPYPRWPAADGASLAAEEERRAGRRSLPPGGSNGAAPGPVPDGCRPPFLAQRRAGAGP